MNTKIQSLIQERLAVALKSFTDDPTPFVNMIRPTTDPKFGDYQINCAMPLANQLKQGASPRDLATQIAEALSLDDICDSPEIAGPGFINLRLKNDWLATAIERTLTDPKFGDPGPTTKRRLVIDYSSPNVAKPMHVGHIRSTVIGDALARIFRFLGHEVISDNHLGDWGTQFGMIIYGYKHFVEDRAFETAPVAELSRLYRLVHRIVEYHNVIAQLPEAESNRDQFAKDVEAARTRLETLSESEQKKQKKELRKQIAKSESATQRVESLRDKMEAVQNDPDLSKKASQHASISEDVLQETAKLHQGDPENRALWERFLPHCIDEINTIYRILDIHFDTTLGESFYHSMLGEVVCTLQDRGVARESEGAICVFLPEFDAPLIVQKQDGAYLYATTDLATLRYRQQTFQPTDILYVVDSRQAEHFEKIFAVASQLDIHNIHLQHINFGTVLGDDGRPFKTRSGTSVGLEGLLNDAVDRAMQVVCNPERTSKLDPPLSDLEKENISRVVGYGSIKYADLAHHRTSDYRFSLKKMIALEGNTSAYVQYAYSRAQGILRRGQTSETQVIESAYSISLESPEERALAIALLRFPETLAQVCDEYAPNFLVDYLYETARRYALFNDNCHVLKADSEEIRQSRLTLVTYTARILRTGLQLLGIAVTDRM